MTRRIARIVSLITEDDAPTRALRKELVSLELRQEQLEEEISEAGAPAPLIHPNLAEVYRQRVAALNEAFRAPATRDDTLDAVRSLIDEIRLTPHDGKLRIDLTGALVGIRHLAAGTKKAGGFTATGLAQQIKMVAGTLNHRQYSISVLV